MAESHLEQRPHVKPADTPQGALAAEEHPDVFSRAVSLEDAAVLIHVRFRPDGTVWEIAECPEGLAKDEWFKKLCARVGDKYQARCGGRGMFRISLAQLEALRAPKAH
jgi:hypothetical protein